jgi:hypothetical protein
MKYIYLKDLEREKYIKPKISLSTNFFPFVVESAVIDHRILNLYKGQASCFYMLFEQIDEHDVSVGEDTSRGNMNLRFCGLLNPVLLVGNLL